MDIPIRCKYDDLKSVDELKPHPKNPNKHPEDQIIRLTKLLSHFGFRHPIVVSKESGNVVVGHGRLEAAKLMGLSKVPVNYQNFQTPDIEYAFLVADNAIGAWSKLEYKEINAELENIGPLDIEVLGLENFEVEPLDNPLVQEKIEEAKKPKFCPHCKKDINNV